MAPDDGSIDWTVPATHTFRSVDHPLADGRDPTVGDVSQRIRIPLEGGETLELQLGARSMEIFEQFIIHSRTEAALRAIGIDPIPVGGT